MGHFKLKLVPQGTMPRDLALGVRMRRLTSGEVEGRARRTFSPPDTCTPTFGGWDITTPPEIVYGEGPLTWYIWPNSATVLCEGDCLDWSLDFSGGPSGSEPNVSIEAGSDCAGVALTIDDTQENLAGWTFTISATLNGAPFGTPYALTVDDDTCIATCSGWIYPWGDTFPILEDGASYAVRFTLDADECACVTLVDAITFRVFTSDPLLTYSYITDVGGCTWELNIFNSTGSALVGGETIGVEATIIDGSGEHTICGDEASGTAALFTCAL